MPPVLEENRLFDGSHLPRIPAANMLRRPQSNSESHSGEHSTERAD